MSAPAQLAQPRGGPLIMIASVLALWAAGRALLWESPLAAVPMALAAPGAALPPVVEAAFRLETGTFALADDPGTVTARVTPQAYPAARATPRQDYRTAPRSGGGVLFLLGSGVSAGIEPRLAAAHAVLWHSAYTRPLVAQRGGAALSAAAPAPPVSAPFLPAPVRPGGAVPDGRWSAAGWAFWRQGSDAAPVGQGRVPIYGANQTGAVLTYRLAPQSRRDPRAYLRAYHALVAQGETEAALGVAARPLPSVPLRLAAELRRTEAAFRSEWRPAAYAVTELPLIALPLGARLEAYGQAGWVGGVDATAFAEGQAAITREIPAVATATSNRLRLSVGAAAWGGAQDDAHRIDLGPTMRFNLAVGAVPAQLSLDWREQVGGDAAPGSGLAATLSTAF